MKSVNSQNRHLRAARRIIGWMLWSIFLFIIANVISYFSRSDGFGVRGVQDGMIRIGVPYVMIEGGGFAHHETVSLRAALINLLIAATSTAFVLGITYLMNQSAEETREPDGDN